MTTCDHDPRPLQEQREERLREIERLHRLDMASFPENVLLSTDMWQIREHDLIIFLREAWSELSALRELHFQTQKACEEETRKNKRYREALDFYAFTLNHSHPLIPGGKSEVQMDNGLIAREALSEGEGE